MAEQKATATGRQQSPVRKKNLALGMAVLGVMILEGGGIFVAMKFLGSAPAGAEAAAVAGQALPEVDTSEVLVVKLRPSNITTGNLYLWDIEIHAVIANDSVDAVAATLETRKAMVEDRLATVIRNARHEDLLAPGLETVKRQLKHELNQIVGRDDVIEEILIPTCTPFRADY
jgi:flagellar basal body-associated protein FliL